MIKRISLILSTEPVKKNLELGDEEEPFLFKSDIQGHMISATSKNDENKGC